jgi:hypothetical protein
MGGTAFFSFHITGRHCTYCNGDCLIVRLGWSLHGLIDFINESGLTEMDIEHGPDVGFIPATNSSDAIDTSPNSTTVSAFSTLSKRIISLKLN